MKKIWLKIKEFWKIEKNRKRVIFFSIFGGIFLWLFWGVPLPTALSTQSTQVSTKLFDRTGKLIYEIYADERRTPIKLEDLPLTFPKPQSQLRIKLFTEITVFPSQELSGLPTIPFLEKSFRVVLP
jgi:hypothetical protein